MDLSDRLAQAQRDARLPSLSAAVISGGATRTWQLGSSAADTQYRIGSISKTFTAALVLQLRDAGRLRLDDPLETHVPGTAVGHLLLRDLLAHASGLRREPVGPFWEATTGRSEEELLSLTPEDVVLPGRRAFHYSNVGYALLGQVVARLHRASWADAVQRRLLDPLGLRRTSYLPVEPYAQGLRVHPFSDEVAPEPMHDTRAMAPAGQLWSTPSDLCAWGAFLADPDAQVLDPATVEEMCEPVVIGDAAWTGGYGLGLQLFRRGDRVLAGHGGSMPGFGAGLAVDRGARVAAAVCANAWAAYDGSGLACDLVIDVLDTESPAPPPWTAAPADPPAIELLGEWWWRHVPLVARVKEGALHVGPRDEWREASRFESAGRDVWVGVSGPDHGERLRVVRDAEGRIRSLDLATYVLTRDRDDPEAGP